MSTLPSGTVTFLFTDIEGSTKLIQRLGDDWRHVLEQHHRILRQAIRGANGIDLSTEGDAFFAVFSVATDAVAAAASAQYALNAHAWPEATAVRVRMGIHTGLGVRGADGYVGLDVHRAARIGAAAHGGQILLSSATRALVEHDLPSGVTIRDLGPHRMKDIELPERLHQLVIDGLPADFPPVRAIGDRPTNLPPESTSFVGREREVAEVTALLSDARLLTLIGPGGTGKTRLAMRVAANQLDRFPDGVFWVDLSEISDPGLVTSAIATSLRVRQTGAKAILDSIVEHLAGRRLLLLLDNFEQVIEASAVVAVVLTAAPAVRVLATSRLPLHLHGEQEYPVPPLTFPDPSGPLEPRSVMGYEAVALFVERANAVRPGFALTPQEARAVVEICARLDGLPLAIELAASRVKVLSPHALLARLAKRLPLLTGGSFDRPERQRTLRSAIEWSYDLLETPERRLFARLAVFAGGWTLESAETVCGVPVADERGAAALDALEVLGSLVDRSLVRRDEAPDGDIRFGMLETIHEFAGERLTESGEEEVIRRRHADHCRGLAEEAEPHLSGERQARWLHRLELEHDNFRGALAWCVRTGQAETGVRIAHAVWRFWQRGGHLAEGRAIIEALLLLPEAQRHDALRTSALTTLGSIAYWQNDYAAMAHAYEEALDIARAIGDPSLIAHAVLNASFVPLVTGDIDRAEQLQREALAEAVVAGAPDVIAEASLSIGNAQLFRASAGAAVAPIEEAIALRREAGDRISVAEGLLALAAARHLLGEHEASAALVREARRINLEGANAMGIVATLVPEASLANQHGRHRRGAQLMGAWARLREELGGGPPPFVFSLFGDPEAQAREVLGDEEYDQAGAEGYAMSLDEAVALADDGPA